MTAWTYLILAGVFEIMFAFMLKANDNFSKMLPNIFFVVFAALSLYMLSKALENISLGTAYSVWTGIGALGTIIIGILFYNESMSILRLFFLLTLISSIIGLKLTSS